MKIKSFGLIIILFSVKTACAQLNGETEIGSNETGESFASQYVNYDFVRTNVLTRYFWVNRTLERGEFAVGPTFKLNEDTTLKFQFGGTTDREIMLAGTLATKIAGHDVLYIVDSKISTTGTANTLYEKVFIAMSPKGELQTRAEHLLVGSESAFLRLGIEGQIKLSTHAQIFFAPFYDPLDINRSFGGQIGFRFF